MKQNKTMGVRATAGVDHNLRLEILRQIARENVEIQKGMWKRPAHGFEGE